MAAPGSEGDDLASRLRIAEAEAAWLRRVLRDKEQAFESEVLMLRRALTKAHEAVECERQQKELTPMLRLLPTDWVKVPTAGAAAQPIPTGPSAEGESIESVQSYGTPSPYLAMHPLARARQRLPWLLGLMLLQSMSSSIIGGYEAFIEQHINVEDAKSFLNDIREKGMAGSTLHPYGDLNPFTHEPEAEDNPESVIRRAKTRAIIV